MSSNGEGAPVAQIGGYKSPRWQLHPTKADRLLRLDQSGLGVYDWASLDLIRLYQIPFSGRLKRFVPIYNSPLLVSVSEAGEGSQQTAIQLWDSVGVESCPGIVEPKNELNGIGLKIKLVIGVFGTRLVVYTTDFWIASVDLDGSLQQNTLIRHFFIPTDWVTFIRKPIIGLGRSGEILFAKQSDLAVIKRGLEVTDTGDRFNPRRGSNQSLRTSNLAERRRSSASGG